jgi:hypothetical protein
LIKRILPFLDDLTYLAGTACIAVGLFVSPLPFLGWIAIGASLIYLSHQIAKGGAV